MNILQSSNESKLINVIIELIFIVIFISCITINESMCAIEKYELTNSKKEYFYKHATKEYRKKNSTFYHIHRFNNNDNSYTDVENDIDWTKDKNLILRKVNVKLLKSYVRGKDIENRSMQGMTVTNKYIIFALFKSDNDTTQIVIVDKNTGKILNIINRNHFMHANDMTWDSKRDEIYILTSNKKIAKFKINENYEMINLSYVECSRVYWSIAYNNDNDEFIGMNGKKMYVMNNKFKEISNFSTPTNLTTQGMGYYNRHIYFCCTENGKSGRYQKIYNSKERSSNLIYKYDLKGNLIETLYVPNTTLYGEIESCSLDKDGKLFINYNITLDGKKTASIYRIIKSSKITSRRY